MVVMNPLNTNIPAAEININATFTADVSIVDDFKLVGKTKEFNFEVTSYRALFNTPESLDDIKNKI